MFVKHFFLFGILELSNGFFYKPTLTNRFHHKHLTINMKNDKRNYSPFGRKYYEEYLRKLNSFNTTIRDNAILGGNGTTFFDPLANDTSVPLITKKEQQILENYLRPNIRIIFHKKTLRENGSENGSENNNGVSSGIGDGGFNGFGFNGFDFNEASGDDDDNDDNYYDINGKLIRTKRHNNKGSKSENFEIVTKSPLTFNDIGGYDNIKAELSQCVDILSHYKKYAKYNVRIPKGLLLEGPPGNGKTMLAKGFAGETNASFIAVSGSQFQDKYVGVGSARVRELFDLASRNLPCIIFIDEIDAIGKKRSGDGESSSSERDSTLNELLVNLDGFKTGSGIFLMGATNRADLLDPALLRPGRIDKRIVISHPDSKTREAIIRIHLRGKPYDVERINVKDLVDMTTGLSGSQIENLLNEAMLNALRENRYIMEYADLDTIINKMMVGWQPNEHQLTPDIIDRIAIHEMGHAIVGFLSKHHSKVSKVVINLSAPSSPGYTMFEATTTPIYKREALFEHLMILLGGRISEEIIYDVSITTGAINDFEEAFKLAEKMVLYYGMGTNVIYPSSSEKYKEMIDDQVSQLIQDAYLMASLMLKQCKNLIVECAEILKREKIMKIDELQEMIETKYPEVLKLKN